MESIRPRDGGGWPLGQREKGRVFSHPVFFILPVKPRYTHNYCILFRMDQHWKVDPVLLLLFSGITIFTGVMIFIEFKFKDDGQLFQVVSGLVAGFAGAFFTRLKPRSDAEEKGQIEKSITVAEPPAPVTPPPAAPAAEPAK